MPAPIKGVAYEASLRDAASGRDLLDVCVIGLSDDHGKKGWLRGHAFAETDIHW
jgi:hypothetical protein